MATTVEATHTHEIVDKPIAAQALYPTDDHFGHLVRFSPDPPGTTTVTYNNPVPQILDPWVGGETGQPLPEGTPTDMEDDSDDSSNDSDDSSNDSDS